MLSFSLFPHDFLVMIFYPTFHCQKTARSFKFKTSESQEQYEILMLFSQSLWTSPFCWLPEQRLPTVWGQMGPDASHRTEAAAAGVCHQTTVVRLVLVSLSLRFKQTGTCRLVQKAKSFSMFSSFCPPPQRCPCCLPVGWQRSSQDPPGPQRGHIRFHQTSTSSKSWWNHSEGGDTDIFQVLLFWVFFTQKSILNSFPVITHSVLQLLLDSHKTHDVPLASHFQDRRC